MKSVPKIRKCSHCVDLSTTLEALLFSKKWINWKKLFFRELTVVFTRMYINCFHHKQHFHHSTFENKKSCLKLSHKDRKGMIQKMFPYLHRITHTVTVLIMLFLLSRDPLMNCNLVRRLRYFIA